MQSEGSPDQPGKSMLNNSSTAGLQSIILNVIASRQSSILQLFYY